LVKVGSCRHLFLIIVVFLQREKLSSTLTEAIETNVELEGKAGQLKKGLRQVLNEERNLRNHQAELKRQVWASV
jgi:hypothetical protein